jgi:hypothetical protein
MKRYMLAAGLAGLFLAGPAAGLHAQNDAAAAARAVEQQRYEQGVRDAEAARRQYEADLARHQAEVDRANAAQADYERRLERYQSNRARREARAAPAPAPAPAGPAAAGATAAQSSCEAQTERNRRRGRGVGGVLGGIAGGIGGRAGGIGNLVSALAPVGQLLGEAIASLLDCDEQQRAAVATEEAVRGGVGTTTTWSSVSRPGVTGSSTVTAREPESGGGECMTVTDVVIVDGEETRAPKRMCRRPPNNRFVRV